MDVTEQNEESIVIETDIGSSVEVTTEDLIESDSLMHNVDYGQTSNFDSEFVSAKERIGTVTKNNYL